MEVVIIDVNKCKRSITDNIRIFEEVLEYANNWSNISNESNTNVRVRNFIKKCKREIREGSQHDTGGEMV